MSNKEKQEVKILKEFDSLYLGEIKRILENRGKKEADRTLCEKKTIWLRCVKQGYMKWMDYCNGLCLEEDFSELEQEKVWAWETASVLFFGDTFINEHEDWIYSLEGEFSSMVLDNNSRGIFYL